MSAAAWFGVGFAAWLALAAGAAAGIARAIGVADRAEPCTCGACFPFAPDDDTWLDDAPVDVLSQAEIDARIARLEMNL